MRLYSDENFPFRTVIELRKLGHDVLTAFEDRRAHKGISDHELLKRASDLKRVTVTLNRRDFIRLHRLHPDHSGIVVCTEDPDRMRQAERIHAEVADQLDLSGRLLRVYRPS